MAGTAAQVASFLKVLLSGPGATPALRFTCCGQTLNLPSHLGGADRLGCK